MNNVYWVRLRRGPKKEVAGGCRNGNEELHNLCNSGDEVEQDELGEACSPHETWERC